MIFMKKNLLYCMKIQLSQIRQQAIQYYNQFMSRTGTKNDSKKVEQDQLTPKLFNIYRKKIESYGLQVHPYLKQRIMEVIDGNKKLQGLQCSEELGPVQIRALMQTLTDLDYPHFMKMIAWKTNIGDQGLRNICKYLLKSNSIEVLDLLNNGISSLGCQFLGKIIKIQECKIKELRLDDNIIGTQGLKNLAIGLRTNPTLQILSLKYCGIDEKGAIYIQQLLANIKTKIKSIILQGNPLKNEGAYLIFKAINLSGETLEEINLSDTKINLLEFKDEKITAIRIEHQLKEKQQARELEASSRDDIFNSMKKVQTSKQKIIEVSEQQKVENPEEEAKKQIKKEVSQEDEDNQREEEIETHHEYRSGSHLTTIQDKIMHQLKQIMKHNLILSKYGINFNPISNDAAQIIFNLVSANKCIMDIQFATNVDYDIRQQLDTLLRKRTGKGFGKPSKKKKAAGKKKK